MSFDKPVPVPCPRCGSRAVVTAIAAPEEQRDPPDFLACRQCGIERGDLEPYEEPEEERAPAAPCPACGCRDVRVRLVPIVQLTFFGPPVAMNDEHFTCALCGEERPDYDPDEWPDEQEPCSRKV